MALTLCSAVFRSTCAGDRIALVGPNGTGKTTLLQILAGHEDADAGQFDKPSSTSIGYLEQQPEFEAGRTVWEEARSALHELLAMATEAEKLARAMAEADDAATQQRLGQRFDHLQQELHRRDGYHVDHKIERVLVGLGFSATRLCSRCYAAQWRSTESPFAGQAVAGR